MRRGWILVSVLLLVGLGHRAPYRSIALASGWTDVFFDNFNGNTGWSVSVCGDAPGGLDGCGWPGQALFGYSDGGASVLRLAQDGGVAFPLVGREGLFDALPPGAPWAFEIRFRYPQVTAYGVNIGMGSGAWTDARLPQDQPPRTDWADAFAVHQDASGSPPRLQIWVFGTKVLERPAPDTAWHAVRVEVQPDGAWTAFVDGSPAGSGSGAFRPRLVYFGNYYEQWFWGDWTDLHMDYLRIQTYIAPPTPTPTPTFTPSPTPTPTFTPTSTPSPTPTPTETPTPTPSPTPTSTPSPTPTETPTPTNTPTPTFTPTPTPTGTPTSTPSPTPTSTPTFTPTPAAPEAPPAPPTATSTGTPTPTAWNAAPRRRTPVPRTPTPAPTETPAPSPSPTPTRTAAPSPTPTPPPPPAPAWIDGVVFLDRNGNGAQDPDEPGIPGAVVEAGGRTIATGPDGRFRMPAGFRAKLLRLPGARRLGVRCLGTALQLRLTVADGIRFGVQPLRRPVWLLGLAAGLLLLSLTWARDPRPAALRRIAKTLRERRLE